MQKFGLDIKSVNITVSSKTVLGNFSLKVAPGAVHVIMGPNGTGKSSLAKALVGHKDYSFTSGEVFLDQENLALLSPHEIAQKGLFLAFQYPCELEGITVANFIRAAVKAKEKYSNSKPLGAREYYNSLYEAMDELEIDRSFTSRYLNNGFSGGEKKRFELLQMLMLKPKYAILDEIDSGLDIDALKIVSKGISSLRKYGTGFLVITHYGNLLKYVNPDAVHVLCDGKLRASGGMELVEKLEAQGYDWLLSKSSS